MVDGDLQKFRSEKLGKTQALLKELRSKAEELHMHLKSLHQSGRAENLMNSIKLIEKFCEKESKKCQ